MTHISRVRVALTGFVGAPGVMTFYTSDVATFSPALHANLVTLMAGMPSVVTAKIADTGDIIEDTTGDLVGSWAEDGDTPVVGTGSAIYAAPCGYLVHWFTDAIVAGHRLRGRTFFVPISADQYQLDGTIADASLAVWRGAAAALVTATGGTFFIWSRPFAGAPAVGTRPARPARAGSSRVVTASSIPDKAVVLRSRRD